MKRLHMIFTSLLILAIAPMGAFAQVSFGNQKGTVTLIEYFDYNCPVCRGYAPTIDALAHKNHNLLVIQRVVPALAPTSSFVDRAVLASYFQGKFAQMQNAILHVSNAETISPKEVAEIARSIGLNLKKLGHDMGSKSINKQIQENLSKWKKFHVRHIPVIVVYPTGHKNLRKEFVGAVPMAHLQTTINQFQK